GDDLVSCVELHAVARVGEDFGHQSFELDQLFLSHVYLQIDRLLARSLGAVGSLYWGGFRDAKRRRLAFPQPCRRHAATTTDVSAHAGKAHAGSISERHYYHRDDGLGEALSMPLRLILRLCQVVAAQSACADAAREGPRPRGAP